MPRLGAGCTTWVTTQDIHAGRASNRGWRAEPDECYLPRCPDFDDVERGLPAVRGGAGTLCFVIPASTPFEGWPGRFREKSGMALWLFRFTWRAR